MISSTRSHWRLGLAVVGSFLLHATLLFNMASQPASLSSARQQTLISAYLVELGEGAPPTQPAAASAAVAPESDNAAHVDPPPAERKDESAAAERSRVVPSSSRPDAGGPNKPPVQPGVASEAQASGYKASSDLDPPPRPLGDIDLDYPLDAGLQQGTVTLRILISETGKVDDVIVLSADPPGVFDAAAVAAFRKALFSPGRYLGVPVRSQVSIAVDYTPTNRGSAVSGQGGFDAAR